MSKHTDDELYQVLTETGRLLKGVAPVEGEEYSLDAILAEFGQDAAKPAQKQEVAAAEAPASVTKPEPIPEPEQMDEMEPPIPAVGNPALMETQSLRQLLEANKRREAEKTDRPTEKGPEPVPPEEKAPEQPEEPKPTEQPEEPKPAERKAPSRLIEKKRPGWKLINGGLMRKDSPEDADAPAEPEKPEIPAEELGDTKEIVPLKKKEEARQPEESPAPPAPSSVFPEEPEGMHKIPLEQVMSQTVEAVLDQDDAILDRPVPLGERVQGMLTSWREKLSALLTRPDKNGVSAWEKPENEAEPAAEEPGMEQAAKEEKRLCKKLHLHTIMSAVPAALLALLTVLDGLGALNGLWSRLPLLRYAMPGILLLAVVLLVLPVWRTMAEDLRSGRPGCELAAGLAALVVLADCVYGAMGRSGGTVPFAAPAAAMVWLCQFGLLLAAESRREAFHLADIGGKPPYGVSVTAAGACKQVGTLDGFYHNAHRIDPARKWQRILVPLFLAMATVLAGVVILSRKTVGDPLWVWSALLVATVPLALPLTGTLPLKHLNHRLVKSGSAVAGYAGARAVSRSRRMVVTDDDLFPPGTVGLNGLKVYGEEIGKVVSYAASITQACHSQLHPLFEQLLAAEGGTHLPVEDLHYFEEGGVGGTIHGESVTMGSAYFMRKKHVTLPPELKLKTGVFLAVDGTLIAIFAIKYSPSRNVEWALRALRRNRIEPVLAVRSCNVTPGLLKRRFNLDAKPVYPDVSTRLALSDLSRETAAQSNAIIYREGLMPLTETAVGSRRMLKAFRSATILAWLGGLCGLLLAYYFTGVGAFQLLDPLRMLIFQALWLLPTWLLSGLVKHY